MTDRQEQVSHDRWSKPEEVGTHMNRLLLRSWDLKEELDRVNREIKQWSQNPLADKGYAKAAPRQRSRST
jgi:hypothetical protein